MFGNKWKYRKLPASLRARWDYNDFLRYRMQEMTFAAIDELLTEEELIEIEKRLNRDDCRELFDHKKLFYQHFSEWIHRGILPLEGGQKDVFEAFVRKHGKVILKPEDGYAGGGVYTAVASPEKVIFPDPVCPSYEELCERNYLAEEYVEQAECYRRIHPASLNTVRVTTFVQEDGSPKILFSANQFGSHGSVADNTDEDGIWAAIEDETGIVTAVEINPLNGYVNTIHPDTGEKILGFQNPSYREVRELALKLALVVPECRLVGWDIAIRADGSPELIEGNVTPELELYQVMTQKGFRSILPIG